MCIVEWIFSINCLSIISFRFIFFFINNDKEFIKYVLYVEYVYLVVVFI